MNKIWSVRFPPPAPLRSGNISPCRAARSDRMSRQACTLRTGYCEDGHTRCVASGQTSNHLKWSDLDLFFARPPRGGPEKFLFLYLNHMNRTEPISDGLRGPDGPEAQYILDGEFDPGSG